MNEVPLKRRASVSYGLGQPPPLSDEGIPILRATNIFRGSITSEGLIRARLEDLPLDRVPLLSHGEILVVRSGAYTGDSALITSEWIGAAPGYDLRVAPDATLEPRFLAYSLLGRRALDHIDLAKSRAAQPHLNAEELGETPIHDASLPEQRAIADFLEGETARIDALITKKRRVIELLDERFEAAVFHAITRGLRAGVAMRPSGLSWVGEIPEAWGTPTVSANFELQLGKMLNSEAASGPDQYPYVRNVNIQWDRLELTDLATMHFDDSDRRRCELRQGDVLVCEGGEVGRAAVWQGDLDHCYFQKAIHRARPRRAANGRYLMYCLRAAAKRSVFAVEGNLSTIVHLTGEQLRVHRFPWPPEEEQAVIVKHLDETARRTRDARSGVSRQIDLLVEHRQALITAAVTGALSVPGVAV